MYIYTDLKLKIIKIYPNHSFIYKKKVYLMTKSKVIFVAGKL